MDVPLARFYAPPPRVRLMLHDRHEEVTNREFAEFVDATGHVTNAGHEGGAWVYRGEERDRKLFLVQIGDIHWGRAVQLKTQWKHTVKPLLLNKQSGAA